MSIDYRRARIRAYRARLTFRKQLLTSPRRSPVRFGVFEADLDLGELRKHGMRLKLPQQAFRVLQLLLERPSEVISRDELRLSLWPADTFVEFDHGLNNAVNRLREVLGDDAQNPRFIETLPRRGYRFIAPVTLPAPVESAAPAPITVTPTTAPPPAPQPPVVSLRFTALAVVLVTVIASVLLIGLPPRLGTNATADPSRVEALAVLPFLNLSTNAEQEYFADGMTEALIAELSIVGGFRVISRTSAMRYKTVSKPLNEIAKELGVDAIVEGSVLREGNRIRVTVQLIAARTDTHLWAQTYERELDTVLALQREVARTIADAVHVTIQGGERRAAIRAVDPDVYELYLRGRHLLNRRGEADLQKALEYFEQVIQRDPAYAPAHAAVAAAWENMADWNNFVPPREGLPKAKAAALRALELDESLAEAHVRLAFVNEVYEWRLADAEKGYQRAIELDPNYADAYQHYALYLSRVDRGQEAEEMARRAQQLDPLSLEANVEFGTRLLDNGKPEQALIHLEGTVELDRNYFDTYVHLSHVFEALKRPADQVAAARRGVEVSGRAPHALQALARAYAATGDEPQAMKILDELHRRPTQRNAFDVAMIHLRLNQFERALDWLVKACDERASALAYFHQVHTGRQFDPIRKDERFRRVMQCAGVSAAGTPSS
jgi:TolB-like protein/DNA-binding winged helix-turn-helix (wHTH) protein/Tfp pilus assembly protein PilF